MKISCIALAGGKSTRLGRNKLFEIIGGKTLFDRVISRLALFESEIIVVTSKEEDIPRSSNYPGMKIVHDVFPGKGSLGGIYTGLVNSKTFYNLIVAGDMPFLNYDLLKYFVKTAEGFDLAAFDKSNKFEPLHAVYSRNCIFPLERLIQSGNARIIELLRYIRFNNVSQEVIDRIDPSHLSFINVNTEEELAIARKAAGEDLDKHHYGLAATR
jgi:molybdenum cofactor guanylyltransferase